MSLEIQLIHANTTCFKKVIEKHKELKHKITQLDMFFDFIICRHADILEGSTLHQQHMESSNNGIT